VVSEPSPRLQWAIIALAFVMGAGVCVWLVGQGWWYLAVILVASSIVRGLLAARQGKPLFPGGRERGADD
jgi:hypothetical protein